MWEKFHNNNNKHSDNHPLTSRRTDGGKNVPIKRFSERYRNTNNVNNNNNNNNNNFDLSSYRRR